MGIELQMLNAQAKSQWMDERMAKGYSFTYEKANVPGATYSDGTPEQERNIAVVCIETGERFKFLWG